MIKVLVQIRKKRDISMDAFIRYYEDNHVPLVNRLLPFYAGYRRNYLVDPIYPPGETNDFHVITELLFANETTYRTWEAALQDEATVAQIRADEANFLDSTATRMWRVRDEGHA
jgi:uncharacterized protein (TIGR02118 family)